MSNSHKELFQKLIDDTTAENLERKKRRDSLDFDIGEIVKTLTYEYRSFLGLIAESIIEGEQPTVVLNDLAGISKLIQELEGKLVDQEIQQHWIEGAK